MEGYENGSPQIVELQVVAMAFQCFRHTLLSVVTDSAYVADITQRLDQELLKENDNTQLFNLVKLYAVLSKPELALITS